MTVLLNRRRLLKGAPSLLAVATLGAFASRNAQATPQRAPEDAARVQHPAYASIDQCLQQAVDDGTVAGVVAMGATERGLVYEGARGWANLHTRDALSPDTIVWLLSMTAQFVLLGGSGQARRRIAIYADAALLRCPRRESLRTVRARVYDGLQRA